MQFFSELLITLLFLFFSITTLSGIGYIFASILNLNKTEVIYYYSFFGLAISLTILEIINFFFPINFYISLAFFFIGTLFFFITKTKGFLLCFKKINFKFFIFILLSIFWFIKSRDTITNFDSGVYHLSNIKWISEFPLIGGLGNLITHMANNSSWFMFVSLVNFSNIIENSNATSGLLMILISLCLIIKCRNKIPYPNILLPIIIASIIFNTYRLSSPSPDLAVNIITLIIFFLLLELLYLGPTKDIKFKLYLIISLCTSLITIKLSGAPFACLVLFFLFFYFKKKITIKELLTFIIFILIILIPHLIRGYYISGYPLFPLTIGSSFFNPEWKMNLNVVESHSQLISCWAKGIVNNCGDNMSANWFKSWILNTRLEILFYLLLSLVLFFFSFIKLNSNIRKILLLSLLPLLSLLIWFYKAPNPRFSISLIMIFLGCSICLFITAYNIKFKFINDKKKIIPLIFLSLLISNIRFSSTTLENFNYILNNGSFPIPKPRYYEHNINNNLTVNIPDNKQCFNITLPCVLSYKEGLYFITNNNGFPDMYFGMYE